jgi:DNA-binding beta-propeller fold protein YncE
VLPGAGSVQSLAAVDPRSVSEGSAAVVGSIDAGSLPREFGASPDGKTFFLANYVSKSLEIIDAEHLPVTDQRSGDAKQ